MATPRRSASAAISAATPSAPIDRAVVSAGTKTRIMSLAVIDLAQQLVEPFRSDSSVNALGDHDGGRAGAIAETVHRLEAESPIRRGFVKVDVQFGAHVLLQRACTQGLACFCPAHVQRLSAGRPGPKEV